MTNNKWMKDRGSRIRIIIQIKMNNSHRTSKNAAALSKTRLGQKWRLLKSEFWVRKSCSKAWKTEDSVLNHNWQVLSKPRRMWKGGKGTNTQLELLVQKDESTFKNKIKNIHFSQRKYLLKWFNGFFRSISISYFNQSLCFQPKDKVLPPKTGTLRSSKSLKSCLQEKSFIKQK